MTKTQIQSDREPGWHYELIDLTRPATAETQVALLGDIAEDNVNPTIAYLRDWSTSNGCVCQYRMGDHFATHVDAPFHTVDGGAAVEGIDITHLIGEAVVLDLYKGDVDYGYTADDLERAGVSVREDDIVLIYSGYQDAGATDRIRQTYLTASAAEWLVEKRVHAVGCEPAGIEHVPDAYFAKRWYDKDTPHKPAWPAHCILLTHNIYIIEGLTNLDRIKGQRIRFAALPLLVPGLSGSPVRAVAWHDRDRG